MGLREKLQRSLTEIEDSANNGAAFNDRVDLGKRNAVGVREGWEGVVGLDGSWSLLPAAEDEVDPVLQPVGNMRAFERRAVEADKLMRVPVRPGRELNGVSEM
jgi:hypothetical protein